MTIHKFCKEVFYGHYFEMGNSIIWNMGQTIRNKFGLEGDDSRIKQLEILKGLDVELEVLDEEAFIEGEHVIYFDADIVAAIEGWYEENNLYMELGADRWMRDIDEVHMAMKHLLIENGLITNEEWEEELEDEFYAKIDEDWNLEILQRELCDVEVDFSDFYFENENLEEVVFDVLGGYEYDGWWKKYSA